VAVTGTSRIQRSVVRRAVGLRAGQPFSRAALNETQRNLYRTDLFTYVSVGLVDSLRTGPDDSLVAIQVRVNEGKLHAVRAGTGYGALDCFRGVTGWTGRNFFGGGRSLDVGARISKVGSQFCPGLQSDTVTERRMLNYELTLTFREPFLLHRSTSGSVSLFAERHSELSTFTRIAQGGQLTVSQILGINVPVNFTYDLSSGRTIADPAVFCTFLNICRLEDTVFSARRRESTLGAEFVWNRANSAQDPTGGNMLSLQVRYASQLIGSDAQRQFTKGTVEFADYERVGRRMVFAWRIRLGALLPARLTALSTPQQFVPPDERFYLGGPNTVRGYSQNELGPLVRVVTGYDTVKTGNSILANAAGSDSLVPQTRTSPTGGDRVVLGNVELRVPLAGRLSGALFVDVGEVYGGQPRAPIETLHVTPGVGIRFATPIGPVRFDVGYNPRSPTPGPLYLPVPPDLTLVDPNYQPPSPTTFFNHLRFHLSVGQPF
jgi:outer membrane protein insertion porin family